MNTDKRRKKSYSMPHARWTAYALAGSASAIASAPLAEADIHYSGIINQHIEGTTAFPLDAGVSLTFLGQGSGFAAVEINQGDNGAFVGPPQFYTELRVSNLARGLKLSKQIFRDSCFGSSTTFTCRAFAIIGEAESGTSGQFYQRGTGIIGFLFSGGSDVQYGWARIKTTGFPDYRLILVDYAWGDPGQKMKTGQRTAQPESSQSGPDLGSLGSLGLLALGATGLRAWRESRKQSVPPKS